MDILTVGVGLVSFGVILIVQTLVVRWLRPELMLRSMFVWGLGMVLLPVLLMGYLYVHKALDATIWVWGMALLLAISITVLLSFVYVLCVFGPFETSVRLRLLREIVKGEEQGISMDELLKNYSHETMLKIRLQRLLGSGDIIEKDGGYSLAGKKNFYFVFDGISRTLKSLIDRKE